MDSDEFSSSLVNPELEELRQSVPKPPDILPIVQGMIEKSASIHAACLFFPVGAELRKKLCVLLSGTKPSDLYSGWENFGNELNLEGHLIQYFKYNCHYEDPTSNVLLAYAQKDSSTLANVIQAVYDIKRYDVILQVEEKLAETCKNVLSAKDFHYNKNKYFAPKKLLDCPFIFKDLTNMCNLVENDMEKKIQRIFEEIPRYPRFEEERLKMAAVTKKPRKNYTKIVMLSYTADANEIVQKLIPRLRIVRENKRLGVLVLHEQLEKVNLNPEQFIFDCLQQVDYVIPVITREYLKAINSCTNQVEDGMLHVDNKYVKYIYTLMMTHYVMNGCKNFKVRGLLPDDCFSLVHTHRLMEHPLLQVWFKNCDIEEVVLKLLGGRI